MANNEVVAKKQKNIMELFIDGASGFYHWDYQPFTKRHHGFCNYSHP